MRTTLDTTRQRPHLETSNSPHLCTLDPLPSSLRYAHRIKCGLYQSIGPDDLSSTRPALVPSDAMINDGSNESSAQEVSGSHTGWNIGCRRFLLFSLSHVHLSAQGNAKAKLSNESRDREGNDTYILRHALRVQGTTRGTKACLVSTALLVGTMSRLPSEGEVQFSGFFLGFVARWSLSWSGALFNDASSVSRHEPVRTL